MSSYDVPARLIVLKKEFITLDAAGLDPASPEWRRMQDIALEIHRDPWWQEVDNQPKARMAMRAAAEAALANDAGTS